MKKLYVSLALLSSLVCVSSAFADVSCSSSSVPENLTFTHSQASFAVVDNSASTGYTNSFSAAQNHVNVSTVSVTNSSYNSYMMGSPKTCLVVTVTAPVSDNTTVNTTDFVSTSTIDPDGLLHIKQASTTTRMTKGTVNTTHQHGGQMGIVLPHTPDSRRF